MATYDLRTVSAIHEALDDEYKARATYEAVIERFGPIRPFVNIIAAEDRHAHALERLLLRAGLPVPADRWRGAVEAPATVRDALTLGVQAEIENRAMYDRLETMTTAPEVLRVFANLRRASQDNHLPAFQRGLDRRPAMGEASASPAPRGAVGAARASGGRQDWLASSHGECGNGGGRGWGGRHGHGWGRRAGPS